MCIKIFTSSVPHIFLCQNTHLMISIHGLCAGECGSNTNSKTKILIIIVVVVSTSLVIIVFLGMYIYYSRKKNQEDKTDGNDLHLISNTFKLMLIFITLLYIYMTDIYSLVNFLFFCREKHF